MEVARSETWDADARDYLGVARSLRHDISDKKGLLAAAVGPAPALAPPGNRCVVQRMGFTDAFGTDCCSLRPLVSLAVLDAGAGLRPAPDEATGADRAGGTTLLR